MPPISLSRLLHHQAIVTCQIRLTLGRIYDNVIDRVVILRCKFYVGRETCAAETYDTGFFYDIPDLFLGKFCVIAFFAKTFDCCVLGYRSQR